MEILLKLSTLSTPEFLTGYVGCLLVAYSMFGWIKIIFRGFKEPSAHSKVTK